MGGPAATVTFVKLVAGVDSSTQSTKVLLCRAEDGTVVAQASAPHPDGTECDPRHWWDALQEAGRDLLERADAVGVAAQQHGMIVLDSAGQVIRPAMLWNDVKSAPQARELVTELGGPAEWAARTGSVPTMSFTVTKLRWLAEREPEHARLTDCVLLPHDWLTWRLGGAGGEPTTDRGDASGTGYFSPPPGRGCLSWRRPRSASRLRCRASPRHRRWSGGPRGAPCFRPGQGTTWGRRW